MRKISFIIENEYDNMTVKNYLMTHKGISRRMLTKLKQIKGGITLNGEHIRIIDNVHCGDSLTLMYEDKKTLEPNNSLDVPVIYEDEDIIVFNKPPSMPCHPSHNHQGDTLGNFFAHCCKGMTFRPINRLDRDTSGCCVVAKSAFGASVYKSVEKVYFAVVHGKIEQDSGVINAPIGRDENSIIRRVISKNSQHAVTNFKVVARTDNYTAVRIILETGRTHQIRVHFSHIGHPLVGDDMYGGLRDEIPRQALHCLEVSFIHPIDNEKRVVKSQLPQDIRNLISEYKED